MSTTREVNRHGYETMYGIATRTIAGTNYVAKTTACIPEGTMVKVTECYGEQYRISAHGIRTLPMTWSQMIARVDPA